MSTEWCEGVEVEESSLADTQESGPAEAEPQADSLPAHVREHYDAIREKERDVRELEWACLEAKREAKDAKEEFDLADKSLRDLIRRGPDPQRKLPLKDDEPLPVETRTPKRVRILAELSGTNIIAGSEHDCRVNEHGETLVVFNDGACDAQIVLLPEQYEVIEWHQPQPPSYPDAWRKAPLTELGLTLKQNDLFADAGVTTIGGLEDFRAQIAEGKAAWPKGIGPVKVTEIEDRIVAWLDKNRDKFGEAA